MFSSGCPSAAHALPNLKRVTDEAPAPKRAEDHTASCALYKNSAVTPYASPRRPRAVRCPLAIRAPAALPQAFKAPQRALSYGCSKSTKDEAPRKSAASSPKPEAPAKRTEPWRPALDPATVPENARAALNNAHDALPEAGQRPPPPPRENGPTPMAKQIQQLIRDNKGCFLAVEVGYKYKCFGTDVPRAAKTLGIGSWKDAQLGDMCTFPTGTIDDKIRRLVRDGHRVAVARQTERAALRQKSGGTFSRGPWTGSTPGRR